ncbi:hypothetical protein GUITHDRAFT_105469 [Guillardia theta CCMP2712]|uniref:Cyclic nucleotide-binding domain-containing protein n=1 Tax=Guillardia theta (strain CCMP2712) TaxID=905079 RepID=L1JL81_GUITC|nr:hypothetical protein GUITHDRAFT_105469 [Guillardia theta CCMP2712]EKX48845.1 hypothetical protein GUITHDRAFT_105469 [Guillardia theta CCMP2712]|eukprot:XP_005835825.1 hypothetical protein GUITHDRAFT_105469 [Guillardia theta CCMP2712]
MDAGEVVFISPNVAFRLRVLAKRARERVAQKHRSQRFLLYPDSSLLISWQVVSIILIVWTIFEVPFTLVFVRNGQNSDQSWCTWDWIMVINLVVDICFMLDVVVNFNTSYLDSEAFLVKNRMDIAMHYLKSWFLLDFLTSLPIDSFLCAGGSESNPGFLRVVKVIRLIKIVRFVRVKRILSNWELSITSKIFLTIIRLFKFCMLMLFSMHLCGCLWMLMAIIDVCNVNPSQTSKNQQDCICDAGGCYPNNWLAAYDLHMYESIATDSELFPRYLVSIYFATVTLTTVGYGDVVPVRDAERACAIFLTLCGAIVFAFCIGSISSLVSQRNLTETHIESELRTIQDFFRLKNLPRNLEIRAKQHLMHTAKSAQHLVHPCFMAEYLTPIFVQKDEILFRALDVGFEMYFVVEGEFEAWNVEDNKVLAKLGKGEYLGEISLFPDISTCRTSTVKAKIDSEVLSLRRDDFYNHIRPHFPDVYEAIKRLAITKQRWLDSAIVKRYAREKSQHRCDHIYNKIKEIQTRKLFVMSRSQKGRTS